MNINCRIGVLCALGASVFVESSALAAVKQMANQAPVVGAGAAIAAVKAYKPKGASMSIGGTESLQHYNHIKDLGWSALSSGNDWIVTWTYVSSMGFKHAAKWRVTLKPQHIEAISDPAKAEENAAKEYGRHK